MKYAKEQQNKMLHTMGRDLPIGTKGSFLWISTLSLPEI